MAGLLEKDQVGKLQDISDAISVADARGTPFTTMIKKGKAPVNALFEWQADAEMDVNIDGTVDGDDVKDYENAAEKRAVLQNRVQIFDKTVKVSTLSKDVTQSAGVKDEFARAKAKAIVAVKRSMEAAFLGDNEMQADDGQKPNRTRGMGVWLQATAQTVNPVPEQYRTPSGSIDTTASGSFTETTLQGVIKSIFLQTGVRKRLVLVAGATLKGLISDFQKLQPGASATLAAVRTFTAAAKDKTIHATVDFYDGDFAELEVVPDLWLGYKSGTTVTDAVKGMRGYVIDPDDIALRVNQTPTAEELPNQGGGARALIRAIAGLQVGNPLKHGKFAATS